MSRRWLLPLVPLYAAAVALRNRRIENGSQRVRSLHFPVVSIGNLSTGGSGKTPLTIALAKALRQRALNVDVLSRGYGRQSRLPARVHPNGSAEDFGDEPILIARETCLPVYVAPQRYDAGLLAEAEMLTSMVKGTGSTGCPKTRNGGRRGFQPPHKANNINAGFSPGFVNTANLRRILEFFRSLFSPYTEASKNLGALAPDVRPSKATDPAGGQIVHLLDDGFQHRQLHRDIDVVLLNRADWHDKLLPAGNLREPLNSIRRAAILAIPADDPDLEPDLRNWGWQGPIWRLSRTMQVPVIDGPVMAFCGIARPQQFFRGLESAGLTLAVRKAFPDHHRYTNADLRSLQASAAAAGATALITTEKDYVRLAKFASAFPETMPLKTAQLRIEIEDKTVESLLEMLAGNLYR